MLFINDATFLRKSRLHQIAGLLWLWLLRYTNTMRPKVYHWYVVLLLVTTLSKFQFFVTIFVHSTTPVCLELLWPSCRCDQAAGVKSTFLLGQPNGLRFCYTQSRSGETKSSSNIVLSCVHFFPILLNLMQKIDCFVPILGHFLPYLARLKPVFRIKLSKIGNLQNWNRKIIELPHVSTERLHV